LVPLLIEWIRGAQPVVVCAAPKMGDPKWA